MNVSTILSLIVDDTNIMSTFTNKYWQSWLFYVLKIISDFAHKSGGIMVKEICLHANMFGY